MTLADLVFRKNEGNSGQCIIESGFTHSYQDLLKNVLKASGFLRKNFEKGERVGILCENGMEFVSSYLACMHSGMVSVPINTTTYSSELGYMISDCQIKAILSSKRFFDGIPGPVNKFLISDVLEGEEPGKYAPSGIEESELAILLYTSGSTGRPNAVRLTHKNLLANTQSIVQYLGPKASDRVMVVLPFYYCYGASLMHMTLVTGGSLVISNRFMFPQKVVDEIAEKGCTIFAGVPSTYKILMAKTRLAESDTSSLRYALQAGGRLPPTDLLKLQKMMPETKIIVMYGQTEATARLSYLPHEIFNSKIGSMGKGIPGVELQVVNENGEHVGIGEAGEIRARGDNISPGYWNRPEETRKTFRGGWLYTGDIGRVDEDGFIFIVGRNKDFIKSGGNRFSGVEIEDAISAIEGVENAAVVGFPDDILGEAVHAFVVSADGVKEEDVISVCRKKLPSYKVPKKVTFLKELPLNAFGKVQKFRLLQEAGYGK